MKVIGVIPARFDSARLPGKPLQLLLGKPILQWVVELVSKSNALDDFYVATDHEDIRKLCEKLQIKYVMTDSNCATGTDRIYQALSKLPICDAVINIQGDEPLLPTEYIDLLVNEFKKDVNLQMVTLSHPIEIEDFENKNAVKVIVNQQSEAIYFSRFPIPFSREKNITVDNKVVQKHIGVYGYSCEFLKQFCQQPQSFLEKNESLEQLRALEMGVRIRIISVPKATQGIDTIEDLLKVERLLKNEK
jgi:3-deoxy-manno-octulosonate cytidylyltransferase (CMP-KDO synthetase)